MQTVTRITLPDNRSAEFKGLVPHTRKSGQRVLFALYLTSCTLCFEDVEFRSSAGVSRTGGYDPAAAQATVGNWHLPKYCPGCRAKRRAESPHRAEAWAKALETMRKKREARAGRPDKRPAKGTDPHSVVPPRGKLSDLQVVQLRCDWVAMGWALGRTKKAAKAAICATYGVTPGTFQQLIYMKHRPLNEGPIATYQQRELAKAFATRERECPPKLRAMRQLPLTLWEVCNSPQGWAATAKSWGYDTSQPPYEPPAGTV
jgi:hypothetical protein